MTHTRKRFVFILIAICICLSTLSAFPTGAAEADDESSLDGTYILYSPYAPSYVGTADQATNIGTAVQHQSYSAHTTQRWVITRISGTNRYRIFTSNGLCLATANTGTDAYLQTPYSTTDYYAFQQWYIEPVETVSGCFGRYRIMTANTYHQGKALGVQGLETETTLILRDYENDTDYRDEWYLCPLDECAFNVSVYYDTAYQTRYASSYTVRMNSYLQNLQRIYISQFGIWINYSAPASTSSYFDQCSAAYTGVCSCATDSNCHNSTSGTTYQYHHTNLFNNIFRFSRPGSAGNRRSIYFIGHRYCTETNHTSEPYYGLCSVNRRMMFVTNRADIMSEKKTTVHEFNHFMGVEDHYGN